MPWSWAKRTSRVPGSFYRSGSHRKPTPMSSAFSSTEAGLLCVVAPLVPPQKLNPHTSVRAGLRNSQSSKSLYLIAFSGFFPPISTSDSHLMLSSENSTLPSSFKFSASLFLSVSFGTSQRRVKGEATGATAVPHKAARFSENFFIKSRA